MSSEILLLNYWEHFKRAKDLALIYPPEHPMRKEVDVALNEIQALLNANQNNSR